MESRIKPYLPYMSIVGWVIVGLLFIQVLNQSNKIRTQSEEIQQLKSQLSPSDPLSNQTIKIGVTTATSDEYPQTKKFIEEIIEKDINEYYANQSINTRFEFIVVSNHGTAASAFETTELLQAMGVKVIIGHPWNTQNCPVISYAEKHGMILFSPAASASSQAIPDDNYLRLAANDTHQFYVLAKAHLSLGSKACIVIGHDYRYGMYETFEKEFTRGGGIVLKRIIVRGEYEADSILEEAVKAVREAIEQHGIEHITLQLMGGGELVSLAERADNFPTIYNLTWFGCEWTANNPCFITNATEESVHLKILSPVPVPHVSSKYSKLNERYERLMCEPLDFQMAATYDAAWIITQAILESGTTDAKTLLVTIPAIAATTHGVSGRCKLNGDGDRDSADYSIMGYGYTYDKTIEYGRYDSDTRKLTWDIEVLDDYYVHSSCPPDLEWNMTFGGPLEDGGLSVQQTEDGGYIVTGYTKSFGMGDYDVYLIKTNSSGNMIWNKTFGGPDSDMGFSVQQCDDGGFIIAGGTHSFGAGESDVYLIRTDPYGNEIWNKTFGGTKGDAGRFVQITSDGGYIISGSSQLSGEHSGDFLLIRTDADGKLLWKKTYDGSGRDLGRCVQQTYDEGFIITGIIDSLGVGKGVYLFKTDNMGNEMWNTTFGGSDVDGGWFVQQTDDGGYLVTGYTKSFGAGYQVYLIKTDSGGRELWDKTWGGSGREQGDCIIQTRNSGFLVCGVTSSYGKGENDAFLLSIDSSGDEVWSRIFGGSDNDGGTFIQQTSDGGCIMTGITKSFGAGSYDVYLVKFHTIEAHAYGPQ